MENTLLTPTDVSKKLGLGITNTYKLFKLNGFPKIKIGRRMFVQETDLTNFLNEHKKSQIYLD